MKSYRPEIDGLRSIAVFPVILFHAGFEFFSGGYVGVDVFFVISGFLITSILLKEQEDGSFTFLRFYERRARRILPALFLVMIVSLPFAYMWMTPFELESFAKSFTAIPVFASNFVFMFESGYFGPAAETQPLLHTWSLAVEEQFYITYPIFIAMFWHWGRKKIAIILGFIALVSIAFAQLGGNISFSPPYIDQNFLWFNQSSMGVFFLPFSRAWELVAGGLTAFYMSTHNQRKGPLDQPLSLLGFIFIGLAVFSFDKVTPYPSVYTLLPVIGTVLIILFARRGTIVYKALSLKICVGIGLVSYSLYLWHQPVFVFARLKWGGARGADLTHYDYVLLILLSFALAYLSWRFVETPFRKKGQISRRKVLYVGAAISIALMLAGVSGIVKKGFIDRFDEIDVATSVYGGAVIGGFPETGLQKILGTGKLPPSFIVYGDSHALQYVTALDAFARENELSFIGLFHPACLSLPGLSNIYNQEIRQSCISQFDKLISLARNNNTPVVLAHAWAKELADTTSGASLKVSIADPEGEELLLMALDRLRLALGDTREYIIIGNVPTTNLEKEGGYLKCVFRKIDSCPKRFPEEQGAMFAENEIFTRYANEHENVTFINPYDAICNAGQCNVAIDDKVIYSDHGHLSIYGSRLVIDKFGGSILHVIRRANNVSP